MANTWREDAIVEAIEIIADKKIAQAGYDKTIKAVINNVLDSAAGKYEIKYQDSLFEAYATSSDLNYQKGQVVSILIPGNDWSRTKTILGGVSNQTLIQNLIPVASNQYNQIGMSATIVNDAIGLSSYKLDGDSILLAKKGLSIDTRFNISLDAYDYIKKGDSIALKMMVRTSLTSSQVGGNYGVIFRLVFKDGNGLLVIRNYIVSNKHVIGLPYALQAYTPIEVLYTDVDTLNFIRIDSIQAFCEGFPENELKENIKDIFISGISINGADALDEEALKGYTMHILDSNGIVLTENKQLILLTAQLKSKGKIVTENVEYYWGIEDGTVFRGSDRYCGWLGDGWRCLNLYDSNLMSYIAFETPDFYFTTYLPQFDKYDGIRNKALARDRNSNIICVAVLQGNSFDSLILIENQTLAEVKIISSELTENGVNKTIYYLDNGHPDLTCYVNNSKETNGYTYQWSIFPKTGKGSLVNTINLGNDNYKSWENTWKSLLEKLNKVAKSQQDIYKENTQTYKNAENNIKKVLSLPYVYKNIYYNFPIKEISGSMKISCTVYLGEDYKGTASIILLNRRLLEGMYSLNIEHGLQVFQYDGKGNSPTSKQLEKPLLIIPLSFTLVDNKGKLITHQQIRLNGWIKWIIPSTQTMLSKVGKMDYPNGATDISVIRADLPLAANYWLVYENLDYFDFVIDDRYDFKKNINYVWLNVKYKDIILDAYTNFSFPKDGDPGTNGTDFVGKLILLNNNILIQTDRIYVSNIKPNNPFGDSGASIDKAKFVLYNNSKKVDNIGTCLWSCPPIGVEGDISQEITYVKKSSLPSIRINNPSTESIDTVWNLIKGNNGKPVNIIRAKYKQEDINYYALIPICYNYTKDKIGNESKYRFKIKPKTGFKYVVYSLDGTRPDYDNTMPFEIVVLLLIGDYYISITDGLTYSWDSIGNLTRIGNNSGKIKEFKPNDNFDGFSLNSAIICKVSRNGSSIGFIHVPIYMILNRYGHQALNEWDGNSILLNGQGNTILAPQIGAGQKLTDNTYTGIFMGAMKGLLNALTQDDATPKGLDTNPYKIGLMGYHHGERTIFLDSQTGKALFGKNNAGRIIFDPSSTVNGNPAALLYSGNYPISDFRDSSKGKFNVVTTGNLSENRNKTNKGMMIDLSTPQIGFGSGNFTVNSKGLLVAKGGGLIAGWTINDDAFYKHTGTYKTGMRSNEDPAFYAGTNTQSNNTPSSSTAYNFFVNHNGYLYSKSGRIASWNIDINNISNGNVGMGNSHTTVKDTFHNQSKNITNGRIWSGNSSGDTFLVTSDGKLYSKSGQIANWNISTSMLTDGNIGMGQYVFPEKDQSNKENPFGVSITARLWGGQTVNSVPFKTESDGKISFNLLGLNFAVSSSGYLYSKKGKIGGWNIEQNKLWAGNATGNNEGIRIQDDGSLNGKNWSITKDGNAYFKNIWGNVQAVTTDSTPSENIYYLTGGGFTANSGGGYSGSGSGYRLGSNGTMYVGGGGSYMNFDSNGLEVKGTIKADAGYIGVWNIDNEGISAKGGGSYLHTTGISIIGGDRVASMTPGWVGATDAIAAYGDSAHFSCRGSVGISGVLTFSDKGTFTIKGGIITNVTPGEGAVWSAG